MPPSPALLRPRCLFPLPRGALGRCDYFSESPREDAPASVSDAKCALEFNSCYSAVITLFMEYLVTMAGAPVIRLGLLLLLYFKDLSVKHLLPALKIVCFSTCVPPETAPAHGTDGAQGQGLQPAFCTSGVAVPWPWVLQNAHQSQLKRHRQNISRIWELLSTDPANICGLERTLNACSGHPHLPFGTVERVDSLGAPPRRCLSLQQQDTIWAKINPSGVLLFWCPFQKKPSCSAGS